MTLDELNKFIETLEFEKKQTCEQTGGCENCTIAIESPCGLVCAYSVILENT